MMNALTCFFGYRQLAATKADFPGDSGHSWQSPEDWVKTLVRTEPTVAQDIEMLFKLL
jgi:hypothetical protein